MIFCWKLPRPAIYKNDWKHCRLLTLSESWMKHVCSAFNNIHVDILVSCGNDLCTVGCCANEVNSTVFIIYKGECMRRCDAVEVLINTMLPWKLLWVIYNDGCKLHEPWSQFWDGPHTNRPLDSIQAKELAQTFNEKFHSGTRSKLQKSLS